MLFEGEKAKQKKYIAGGGLVAKSCPTVCDPMDNGLSGSFVGGILQARILEWVAISFSRGSCPQTQGLNPPHLHRRWILLLLSHQRRPHVLQIQSLRKHKPLERNNSNLGKGGKKNQTVEINKFSQKSYSISFFSLTLEGIFVAEYCNIS